MKNKGLLAITFFFLLIFSTAAVTGYLRSKDDNNEETQKEEVKSDNKEEAIKEEPNNKEEKDNKEVSSSTNDKKYDYDIINIEEDLDSYLSNSDYKIDEELDAFDETKGYVLVNSKIKSEYENKYAAYDPKNNKIYSGYYMIDYYEATNDNCQYIFLSKIIKEKKDSLIVRLDVVIIGSNKIITIDDNLTLWKDIEDGWINSLSYFGFYNHVIYYNNWTDEENIKECFFDRYFNVIEDNVDASIDHNFDDYIVINENNRLYLYDTSLEYSKSILIDTKIDVEENKIIYFITLDRKQNIIELEELYQVDDEREKEKIKELCDEKTDEYRKKYYYDLKTNTFTTKDMCYDD